MSARKIMLSAKKDSFWLSVFDALKSQGCQVVYWIGLAVEQRQPDECFFHEVVDAYLLSELYPVERKKIFDIRDVRLEEYYNYLKILDRADNIGGYSFSQRDRLFKEQLSYWYSVLSDVEPDLIVFSNLPHLLYDYPLYIVAKHVGIETLIFNVTPFKGWHFVTDSLFSSEHCNLVRCSPLNANIECFFEASVTPYADQKYTPPEYMKKQFDFDDQYINRGLKRVVKKVFRRLGVLERKKSLMRSDWQKNIFDYFNMNQKIPGIGLLYSYMLNRFKKELKCRYEQLSSRQADFSNIKKYIYVPLHYQPEATTAPLGNVFSDQIYMLEKLRASLPGDVAIVVKEHYSQFSFSLNGFRGRYLNYYDKIASMQNTFLVPLSSDPKELILNSLAVATVTGTSGWEAIQYGKHCIVFGEPWYSSYPGLIKYDDNFYERVREVVEGDRPVNNTSVFLKHFCQSLINVDIHGYNCQPSVEDTNIIAGVVRDFINKRVM